MAKRKTAPTTPEPTPKTFLDHLAEHHPGSAPARKQESTKPEGKSDPTPAEIMARIDAMDAENKRLRRENIALMGRPPQINIQSPQVTPKKPSVNLKDLPDPTTDPEKFNESLQERLTAAIDQGISTYAEQQRTQTQRGQSQTELAESLWDDFNKEYEDLAEYDDLIEFAAGKVARRAASKGIDPEHYLNVGRSDFLEEVAEEVRKYVGKEEGDEGDDDNPADRVEPNVEEDLGRTAGIMGGSEAGGKSSGKATSDKPTTLTGDLRQAQKASDFF